VGAKILLIGVGNDKNTFIHSVEEVADIPDRLAEKPYEVTIIDQQGNRYTHPQFAHHCSRSYDVSKQFPNFEKALVEMGAQTFGRFGNAEVRIVDAAKCREILLRIFQHAVRDLCIEKMEIPEEWYK
jgi:aminoglycoside 3-N-acetyltransferase